MCATPFPGSEEGYGQLQVCQACCTRLLSNQKSPTLHNGLEANPKPVTATIEEVDLGSGETENQDNDDDTANQKKDDETDNPNTEEKDRSSREDEDSNDDTQKDQNPQQC
jgi:hypothetical protein